MYATIPAQLRGIISPDVIRNMAAQAIPSLRIEALKLEAYTRMQALVPGIRETIRKAIDENLGILSLTEDPTSLLMWAHYANAHQGFVIGFDSDSPFFNQRRGPDDEFRHLRPVLYQQERPTVVLTEMEDFSPFLTKGRDWCYEHEWRMMLPLSTATTVSGEGPKPVHLFAFPRTMVQCVILGCRMSEDKVQEVRQIMGENQEYATVACVQAVLDETQYRLIVPEPPSPEPDRALQQSA